MQGRRQRPGFGISLAQMLTTTGALTAPKRPLKIWQQTNGRVTHFFVASMGTTGTVMGPCSRYFKRRATPTVPHCLACNPSEGAPSGHSAAGQKPTCLKFLMQGVDQVMDIGQVEANHEMRALAEKKGIFCGVIRPCGFSNRWRRCELSQTL